MRLALTKRQFDEMQILSDMLRLVMYDVGATLESQFPNRTFRVTSIWRTPQEDAALGASGVHTELTSCKGARAIDIAMPWSDVLKVAAVVNRKWQYDPKVPRRQVIVTRGHGTGPHLHCQVRWNTRPRR